MDGLGFGSRKRDEWCSWALWELKSSLGVVSDAIVDQ